MIKINIKKTGYSQNGNWYYHVKYVPLYDEYEYFFRTLDLDSDGNYDSQHSVAFMFGKIPESNPTIIIKVPEYLGKDKPIKWRLDKGETIEDNWLRARINLFFPEDFSEVKPFIKSLLQSDKIMFEIPTHTITLFPEFDLEGLGEVILPYLSELGLNKFKPLIEVKKSDKNC